MTEYYIPGKSTAPLPMSNAPLPIVNTGGKSGHADPLNVQLAPLLPVLVEL
jgi:hypothetical protein